MKKIFTAILFLAFFTVKAQTFSFTYAGTSRIINLPDSFASVSNITVYSDSTTTAVLRLQGGNAVLVNGQSVVLYNSKPLGGAMITKGIGAGNGNKGTSKYTVLKLTAQPFKGNPVVVSITVQ